MRDATEKKKRKEKTEIFWGFFWGVDALRGGVVVVE